MDRIDITKLSTDDKYKIIFELILIIRHIHSLELISRDFTLNNIIINQNNDPILIDMDRIIKEDEQKTIDFNKKGMAPDEYKTIKFDIFSLGYIMYYLLNDKEPNLNEINEKVTENNIFTFEKCLNEDPTIRPSMSEVIYTFYVNFLSNNKDKKNIYESLLKENNYDLFILGLIYENGKYIERDINKAIHYYTLAANQNNSSAQFSLGLIYYLNQYVKQDINKSIHYFSLAANQNNSKVQYNLGVIYEEGQYVTRDIDKAINYYTLAADQNHSNAQYNLGAIYYLNKYITCDINKAIHYFSLAAK